jgi:hypothetical protein
MQSLAWHPDTVFQPLNCRLSEAGSDLIWSRVSLCTVRPGPIRALAHGTSKTAWANDDVRRQKQGLCKAILLFSHLFQHSHSAQTASLGNEQSNSSVAEYLRPVQSLQIQHHYGWTSGDILREAVFGRHAMMLIHIDLSATELGIISKAMIPILRLQKIHQGYILVL